MNAADPFETASLRQAVLESWEGSPTRFREDANAEEDLRLGGYRDRLLVELAQNAADAASAAGVPGVLRVSVSDGELRVANTGEPLTAAGVTALASLRASAKREGETVGRFGVGFAAVLAVSDEPRVVSTSGGVAFSDQRTRQEVAALPGPAEELASRGGHVPILRLAWPVGAEEDPVPEGFDTEVRLPLRGDVADTDTLLAEFDVHVPDLLLALPALTEVHIGQRSWWREDLGGDRVVVHGPDRTERWLLMRASGRLPDAALATLGAESRGHAQWWVCWALPLDSGGDPAPLPQDVLHAPTLTEERLSLPARLLASVPLEPDRRRVLSASRASDAVLVFAAETYPALVGKVDPVRRTALVPVPGFPLSDVDDRLRQGVLDHLRVAAWLPAADGRALAPHASQVLDHASPRLVELLREVIPGLLTSELSASQHRKSLSALEVPRLGAGDLVAAVTGVERPPRWWRELYDALAPIADEDPVAREEFAALPVPLADGRTVTGVRDVLLSAGGPNDPARILSTLDISGLRIAAAEATHPLLERLGAGRAGPAELLDAPALVDAVRNSVTDARAGADAEALAVAVLRLAEMVRTSTAERDWLANLALPDHEGEYRRAEELLLPGAALLDVLAPEAVGKDAALGVLDDDFAARWDDMTLRGMGVLDSFALHVEEEPARPDPELVDAEQWWAEREAAHAAEPEHGQWPPARFVGVRDLDLVAEDRWPAAIRLLTDDPRTLRALRDPDGYTAWWIARYASLAGSAPKQWRLPGAEELAGLYSPVPDVGLTDEQLGLVGVRSELRVLNSADAADLVDRLADRERAVRAGTALRAHVVLADALATGVIDSRDLDPPTLVRSLSGAVVAAERAVVLDEPWLLGVLEAPLVVAGGNPDVFDAEALAELLDLPLASEEIVGRVRREGRVQRWRDVARVATACELLGVPVPDGEVHTHDELWVDCAGHGGGTGQRQRVHWWVEATAAVHAERTPDGLGRALAWQADRWPERFAFAALLADPEATTLLR